MKGNKPQSTKINSVLTQVRVGAAKMHHEYVVELFSARNAAIAKARKQPGTLAELADFTDASRRTTMRYIEALTELGAPIEMTIKPNLYRLTRR
jgi:predicted DNA-binding transcriptional regulator YafY